MVKVMCIDPGYSLKEATRMFSVGNYPGHCLYGINHFSDEIKCILEPEMKKRGRIKEEFCHLRNYFRYKPDVIYLTFCDYGILIAILHRLKIVKAPIVALFHGYTEDISKCQCRTIKARFKNLFFNFFRKIEFFSVDIPIFINKLAYKIAPDDLRKKYLELMPEKIVGINAKKETSSDVIEIVSVGKTNRDYMPLVEAAQNFKDIHVIIIGKINKVEVENQNLNIINKTIQYKEVSKYYEKASIICVPARETGGGVYGLSSILDAISFGKPILASNTEGLGVDIDKMRIGCTYECGNYESLYNACKKIKENYDEYRENIKKLLPLYNTEVFGEKLSEIIVQIGEKK